MTEAQRTKVDGLLAKLGTVESRSTDPALSREDREDAFKEAAFLRSYIDDIRAGRD